MGYFDALVAGSFKIAPDGQKLFYPFGVLGRGYAVASQQDYDRLKQQIKFYTIVSLVVIIGAVILFGSLTSFAVAALLVLVYLTWLPFLLRGLRRSGEKLSLQESLTSQARAQSAVALWLLEIGALAFVAIGIVMLVVDPARRALALTSIVFFGLAAAVFTYQLVLRRGR